ncbi:MAG: LysE family transporter [Shimia sp.]|nr:LysE family transporter [Shimia sp.]
MLETFAHMDNVTLWAFMAASLVMYLTPVADMMFTIASGISGGPKAGLAATVGVILGLVAHITLAAAGLAVLIAASPTALLAIRYAGAAYLVVSMNGLSAGIVGAKLKQATGILNKIAAVIFGGLAAKLVFD